MAKFAVVALFDLRTEEIRLSMMSGGRISNQEFPRALSRHSTSINRQEVLCIAIEGEILEDPLPPLHAFLEQ